MAAFDMNDPKAIVSPGGVGFDINCGVRLLRTNLCEKDFQPDVKVNKLTISNHSTHSIIIIVVFVVIRKDLPKVCLTTFLLELAPKE